MRKELLVPVDGKGLAWPRKVANAIAYLLKSDDSVLARLDAAEAAATALAARVAALEAGLRSGTLTPEGAVTAPVGTLFRRTDGGALTSFYVKESGAGNTGWVPK